MVVMFEWKKEYSVNIPSIDSQHQQLFAIADELHVAMVNGQTRSILMKIFNRLANYTLTHFAHEERLMEKNAYPDLAAHRLAHAVLKKQVAGFQEEFQAGKATISVELMTFLKKWLENHIQVTDMKYSPYLIQRKAG
jgi:hemerythrin